MSDRTLRGNGAMTVPKLASPVTPADHVLGWESARVTLVE
jgi:hypothetical protein